ncbi:MAG: energy-coupling factor transporter transmembrane component T [Verrucomicrobiota bacterium]|nr:energy-coupling factor transporter transmembrane component T [Verrucomicrobiota bacterium]
MNNLQIKAGDNYLASINTLTKLFITLFFSIFIVFMKDEKALIFLFVASCLYVLPMKKFKAMLIGYAMILLMFISSIGFSYLLGLFAKRYGLKEDFVMLIPFLRVGFMINLTLALTLSSGIRKLINVLKTLRFPRTIFLPTIVIFRFLPSFINDVKQIHESIKIKIGSFNILTMISKPRLFIRLMIIPSVIRALKAAEDLSAAAELKGISGINKITNSNPEHWSLKDVLAFIILSTVVCFAIILNRGEI